MLLNVVRLCVQDATLEPERRRNRWVFFVTQERKIDDRHCGSRFPAVPEDFDDFAITCPRSGGRVVVPQVDEMLLIAEASRVSNGVGRCNQGRY